jgi:endoglucanase
MKRIALVAAIALCALPSGALGRAPSPPTVRVQGNRLVDGSGRAFRLLGVNRSGTEYACVQDWGIFDGPVDARAISAMRSWRVNAVRVPLNEDCWLRIGELMEQYSGTAYRTAIAAYVRRLHAAGLLVILELHWNGTGEGGEAATQQQEMADAEHSIEFWRSIAATFRTDRSVIFDLYNEPHDVSWTCWRNGCKTRDGWQTAGMQELVSAIRSTGARQPIMLGGLGFSSDLSGLLAALPRDPQRQLVASFHVYNFSGCRTTTCWNATVRRVARRLPVVTGELGEDDCAHSFVDRYMRWADRNGVSYLGWAWNVGGCRSWPSLIASYSGRPTAYGAGLRAHLQRLAERRK